MYYVYVISSNIKKYIYVGLTNNLHRRINQHQNGRSRSTKRFTPFSLVITEKFKTRLEARQREKYLKSGIGKEWIKKTFSINI